MNRLPLKYRATTNVAASSQYTTAITSDEDDDDDTIIPSAALTRARRFNPNHIPYGHNHRGILDSSESEDDVSRQPRYKNDIKSFIRMMMNVNLNKRGAGVGAGVGVAVGAGVGRSQLALNHDHRHAIADYSDYSDYTDYSDSYTDDDEGMIQCSRKIKHFSHPHSLTTYNVQQYCEIKCKICGLQLVGSGYGCQSCQFYLHASCFDLPQKIQHDAHRAHPLTLRYPSYYKHCGKTCNACCEHIKQSFLYCCDLCDFDLHVSCATLYSIIKRADTSKDSLRLYYMYPFGNCNSNMVARCDVCYKKVSKEGWLYYSKDTGYIAHINCAKGKGGPSWIKERLNMLKIK